ncbi:adhesion G protein-coupled receptor E3-like [Anoplophora glabripennis]|uniref:adhesion G protein-coupled receptor E3-like n=1 Tax=Anoplophora glabripennis TaxID=217634 RepID=UPI000874AC8F|nr:adhesion G protein-coupled receptor E3-like [Anoplophora glabripennis]
MSTNLYNLLSYFRFQEQRALDNLGPFFVSSGNGWVKNLFSDLRNLSGTTLMNLLAALFMSQLLYVVGVGGVPDSELCIALAFALQYARLCVFCWMLLMTHNMHNQFRTGLHLVPTTDNHIAKNFVRYSLVGWGLPSVLLGASILVQYHDKAGKLLDTRSLKGQNCWFLDRNAFIYGLLAPSCILVAVNFYYLVRSAVLARYIISIQADIRIREKMRRKRTLQILLFTKLTVALSIVLALAAATKLTKSDPLWIAYHVGQGLQGILVAMLVTCNCQVLKLYTRSLRSRATRHVPCYTGRGTATALSKSTSLQLLTWDPVPDPV